MRKNLFNNWLVPAAGFLLGCAVFLFIYGLDPLRVTGSAWIFNGVIESDILQHHAGWMFFRNSDWSWPLGMAQTMGIPHGANIAYTDSIPLVAIFFKMISALLPHSFQFLGLYTLLSFALQGTAAALLIQCFTPNKVSAILGSLLFIFSSSQLERAFRHTALASHWLILFALVLFFKQTKAPRSIQFWLFGLLSATAIGIHPYLFVMVLSLFLAMILNALRDKRKTALPAKTILFLSVINLGFAFLTGVVTGVLSGGDVDPAGGFGKYSLNLNQFMNPTAKGMDRWSLLMKKIPQLDGQEDGLYYLGAGILIFSLGLMLFEIFRFLRCEDKKTRLKQWGNTLARYDVLLILCLGLILFSLSNRITLNDRVIFSFPLPDAVLDLCNLFRSGGRFFLIPYYLWILMVAVGIIRIFPRRKNWLLLILVCVQLLDITPALNAKRSYFRQDFERPWLAPIWEEAAQKYSKMIVLGENRDVQLAGWIAEHGMETNMMFSAPVHLNRFWKETAPERADIYYRIISGERLDDDAIYLFDNENWLPEISTGLNPLYEIIQTDNYYRIYYMILQKETSAD